MFRDCWKFSHRFEIVFDNIQKESSAWKNSVHRMHISQKWVNVLQGTFTFSEFCISFHFFSLPATKKQNIISNTSSFKNIVLQVVWKQELKGDTKLQSVAPNPNPNPQRNKHEWKHYFGMITESMREYLHQGLIMNEGRRSFYK